MLTIKSTTPMKNLMLILICSISLLACKENPQQEDINITTNIPKIDTISYELKSISKESGDCGENGERCTKADAQYIIINAPQMTPALTKINTTLENTIKGNAPTVAASLDSFMAESNAFFEEFPDVPTGYGMEITQEVLFDSLNILTVEEFSYAFTGGAHGNYGTGYYNFNTKTGQSLGLGDILVTNYQERLKGIVEPIFRKAYLEEGMKNYSEAGFYFEEDEFVLTDNFAITKDGLKFLYNPYEIGPYAMGQQEIIIPYNSLKTLIRKDGALASF